MDAEALKRLRSSTAVQAVAGVYNDEPAIDYDERKSDAESAFPAAIQTVIAGPRSYDQDGRQGTETWRLRWECIGLDPDTAKALSDAIAATLEPRATIDGVRFGKGFVVFERSASPEDVGDLRMFRRIVDMELTATY